MFGINIVASGSTAIKFYTSGSGNTLHWQENFTTAVTSLSTSKDYGINGILFPDGLYVYPDSATSQITVIYRKDNA
jgi:hypothetical protein